MVKSLIKKKQDNQRAKKEIEKIKKVKNKESDQKFNKKKTG